VQIGAMARILDVAGALRARTRYNGVEGGLRLCVEDLQVEENSWPLDVTFTNGAPEVAEAGEPGGALTPVSVSIGPFTLLYLGVLSATEARDMGLLDGSDDAVGLLDRAFAGPPPDLRDWF
jgi:predicted acetyltransferase